MDAKILITVVTEDGHHALNYRHAIYYIMSLKQHITQVLPIIMNSNNS